MCYNNIIKIDTFLDGIKRGLYELIAYIKGIVEFIHDDTIIVDVNGIGYEIFCANPYAFQDSLQEQAFIYTYQHVREDAIILFGFKTEDEKHLFTKLISVSGIGPKSGIQILGGANVNDFVAAVEAEDEKFLTQFPGVGKKTARQIILDLKGKLDQNLVIEQKPAKSTNTPQADYLDEVTETLKALGYRDNEIKTILPALRKEEATTTDQLVKKALALLFNQ